MGHGATDSAGVALEVDSLRHKQNHFDLCDAALAMGPFIPLAQRGRTARVRRRRPKRKSPQPTFETRMRAFRKDLAATYSPTKQICSTIGAKELNFRVRDGIGCGLLAIATGKSILPDQWMTHLLRSDIHCPGISLCRGFQPKLR